MPAREPLTGADPCELADRWVVDPQVMIRAVQCANAFTRETGREVLIISGHRTAAEQRALEKAGRPTAAPELSTHLSCPATGIDINAGFGVTNVLKAIWGRIVVMHGLRWGGGSQVDPKTGIPADWNHIDAGPRRG